MELSGIDKQAIAIDGQTIRVPGDQICQTICSRPDLGDQDGPEREYELQLHGIIAHAQYFLSIYAVSSQYISSAIELPSRLKNHGFDTISRY